MTIQLKPFTLAVLGLVVLITSCTAVGAWIGLQFGKTEAVRLPIPLRADTAVKGKTLSMATGLISPEVEGLYILDHASGNLQCWILNPRTGAVGGIFQTNVSAQFGLAKDGTGDYTIVTGGFAFTGGVANNMSPANSIVYVADETTGNVVGYNFTFNRTLLNRGVSQQGTLNVVCKGATRAGTGERDQ
jgi:hypothetical protein